jgi:hypothetical protein
LDAEEAVWMVVEKVVSQVAEMDGI